MSKTDITIEDLLEMGMSLEDIISKKQSPNIKVDIDASEFKFLVEQVAQNNANTLVQIKQLLENSNNQSKQFLNKTVQLLAKQLSENKSTSQREIKGLKVIRNSSALIDKLEFIR